MQAYQFLMTIIIKNQRKNIYLVEPQEPTVFINLTFNFDIGAYIFRTKKNKHW